MPRSRRTAARSASEIPPTAPAGALGGDASMPEEDAAAAESCAAAFNAGRGGAGYLRRGTIRVDITTRLSCDTAAAGGGLGGGGLGGDGGDFLGGLGLETSKAPETTSAKLSKRTEAQPPPRKPHLVRVRLRIRVRPDTNLNRCAGRTWLGLGLGIGLGLGSGLGLGLGLGLEIGLGLGLGLG